MREKKVKYPYQDLTLANLSRETWKVLPGYDGEYEISSLGLAKSLRRWRGAEAGVTTRKKRSGGSMFDPGNIRTRTDSVIPLA